MATFGVTPRAGLAGRLGAVFSANVLRWAASLLAGVALAGAISTAAWLALSGAPDGAGDVEYVIPAGTAERISQGTASLPLPRRLTLARGDTLVLRNQDSVDHRIGGWTVLAGGSLRLPAEVTGSQTFVCTFHPAGSLGLAVRAPGSPLVIVWPTLLLGVPLGLVLGAVWWVLTRLMDEV